MAGYWDLANRIRWGAGYPNKSWKYRAQAQAEPVPVQYISDYDDPYELNSIADAILATANPRMRRMDLGGVEKIPVLNIATSIIMDVMWDKAVRPIVEDGDWKASGLNTLTNLFETLDIAVNPIRAFVQGESDLEAMGWGSGGRKNFDYNIETGAGGVVDWVANMAAEFVSDPFNWITFGSKALATGALKGIGKEAFEEGAQRVLRESGEELIDGVGGYLTRAIVNDDVADDIFKIARRKWFEGADTRKILGVSFQTSKGAEEFSGILKETIEQYEKSLGKTIVKKGAAANLNAYTKQALLYAGELLDSKISNSVLGGLRSAVFVSENIQKGLLASVMRTSPIGLGLVGAKAAADELHIVDRLYKRVVERIARTSDDPITYIRSDALRDELEVMAKANKNALNMAGIDENRFVDLAMEAVQQKFMGDVVSEFVELLAKYDGSPAGFRRAVDAYVQDVFKLEHVEDLFAVLEATENTAYWRIGSELREQYNTALRNANNRVSDGIDAVAKKLGPLQQDTPERIDVPRYAEAVDKRDPWGTAKAHANDFLRDDYEVPITYRGVRYGSVEEAYIHEAFRYADAHMNTNTLSLMARELDVDAAKRLFNKNISIIRASGWFEYANEFRIELWQQKFISNPVLRDRLVQTGDAILNIEDRAFVSEAITAIRAEAFARTQSEVTQLLQHVSQDVPELDAVLQKVGASNPTRKSVSKLAEELRKLSNRLYTTKAAPLSDSAEATGSFFRYYSKRDMIARAGSESLYLEQQAQLIDISTNVLYKEQVSKRAFAREMYASLEEVIDNITRPTQFREDLLNSARAGELLYMSYSISAYQQLLADINALDLPPDLKKAAVDVLSTLENESLSRVNKDRLFTKFKQILTEQTYSQQRSQHALKLEVLAERYADELYSDVPDLAAYRAANPAHTAPSDVDAAKRLTERVLQHDFGNARVMYLDEETTSNLWNTAHIHEIATDVGGIKQHFYFEPPVEPDLGAMRTVLGVKQTEGMLDAQIRDMFRAYVQDRNNVPFDAFLDYLYREVSMPNARPLVLATYNGEVFDMRILRRYIEAMPEATFEMQLKKRVLLDYFRGMPDGSFSNHFDIYNAARKHFKLSAFGDAEFEQIRRAIEHYIDVRNIAAKQYNITNAKLIYKADWRTQSMLSQISDELRGKRINTATTDILDRARTAISEVYQTRNVTNERLAERGLIDKNIFESDLADWQNVSLLFHELGTDTNPRKQFDQMLMRVYFDIDNMLKEGTIDVDAAARLFRKAERFETHLKLVQRPDLLARHEADFDALLKLWLPHIVPLDPSYALAAPKGSFQKYAVLQQIYNDLHGHGGFVNELMQGELQGYVNAMLLLQKPKLLWDKPMTYLPSERLLKAKHMDDELFDALKHSTDRLEDLARLQDANNIFNSGDKASFNMQHELVNQIYEVTDYFNKQSNYRDLRAPLELYTDVVHTSKLNYIIKQSPQDFAGDVWSVYKGILRIDFDDVAIPESIRADYASWLERLDDLRAEGLSVIQEGSTITIGINPKELHRFVDMPTSKLFDFDIELSGFDKRTQEQLKKLQKLLDKYSNGRSRFSTGDTATFQHYQALYDALPDAAKDGIMAPALLKEYKLYEQTMFDHSFIGNHSRRKLLNEYAKNNILNSWVNSAEYLMDNADSYLKMRVMFFGDNSAHLVKNMFGDVPAQEIVDTLKAKRGEFSLVIMTTDKHSTTGFAIRELPVTLKHVQLDNVAVMPKVMALDLMNAWNKMEFSNDFMRAVNKLIVSPMKSGYLMTFGWVLRNFISTEMANITSLDGLDEIGDLVKSQARAATLLRQYTEWYRYAVEHGSTNGLVNKEGIAALREFISPEDWQMYLLADRFINSAASGGQIDEVIRAVKGTAEHKDWIDAASDTIQNALWEKNPMGRLVKTPNDFLEQANRFGQYLMQLDKGAPSDIALSRVIRTHFNYDKHTYGRLIAEMVLPFSGFMWSNLKYWVDAMAKHGWVGGLVTNFIQETVELEKYNNYELNENRSVQYNILAGNKVFEDNTTFKLSLAVMDAYSAFTSSPYETLRDKLWSPLRLPVRMVEDAINNKPWTPEKWKYELATNLPIIGTQLQRWYPETVDEDADTVYIGSARTAFKRTGSLLTQLLPSIFGGVQRFYFFTYDNGEKVYMTTNVDKYNLHLEKGAEAIFTKRQLEELLGKPMKKTYRKQPAKTYYKRAKQKRVYAPRVYAKRINPKGVYNAVMSTVWKTTPRYVERSANIIGPRLYKKLYTAKGQSRLKQRLMPVNAHNLKYKIRQSWSLLR